MTHTSDKSEVAAAYDEWAETYDCDLNRTRELAGNVLRQVSLPVTGTNVLEIGCGTGRNTEWLAENASSTVALDFSEGMLRQAQARVSNSRVRFIRHDVRDVWPLADASADLVIAMLVLEHVEKVEFVFTEAARTLTKGGELFICELHPARQLMGKQARFTSPRTGEDRLVAAYLHLYDDYLNAGRSAGFELISAADWHDADAPADPPRLLSMQFRLGKKHI